METLMKEVQIQRKKILKCDRRPSRTNTESSDFVFQEVLEPLHVVVVGRLEGVDGLPQARRDLGFHVARNQKILRMFK